MKEGPHFEEADVSDKVPNLKRVAGEFLGKLLWLVRGSRPDLAVVARTLGSHLTR